MTWINNFLDNREIAIFIWVGVLFLWALINKKIRKSLTSIIQAVTQKPVAVSGLLMILYIGLIIYFSYKIHLWGLSNWGTIVIWIFGTAFVMFVNINHVHEDNYIQDIVVENLKFIVILEIIINIYVFNLWVELLLVPIFVFIGLIWGYASTDPKYKIVHSCFTTIVGLIGLFFIVYAAYNIIVDFQGFVTLDNLRDFIIPLVFTTAFLPFIYVLALYLSYDLIYMRIRNMIIDKKLARYAKIKTMLAFHINIKKLRVWLRKIVLQKYENKEDIDRAIKDVKATNI